MIEFIRKNIVYAIVLLLKKSYDKIVNDNILTFYNIMLGA